MDKIIKNISVDQKEILWNIMQLHNGGNGFYADMTYSSGKFYEQKSNDKYIIPQPTVKLDVCPQNDDIIKINANGKLPFDDNSIPSLVVDLPFVISIGPSMKSDNPKSNIISKRFASYYPRETLFESYYHWMSEAYRVLKPNGILVWKTQGTVSGGLNLYTPEYSWLTATMCGFYPKDQFILSAKSRLISGKIKAQQHARKFTSIFWVFEKNTKEKIQRYFTWCDDETKNKIMSEFKKSFLK